MRYSSRPREVFNKINIFIVGSALITFIIIARLFQLQVLAHDHYQEIATREQYGMMELPAQRGDIIIKDYHSNEEFPIATNTTLNLLYADPAMVKDPIFVADNIAPLIFDIEDARAADNERIEEMAKNLAPELSPEELEDLLSPKTDSELEEDFRQKLITKISEKQRNTILLATEMEEEILIEIKSLGLTGIEIIDDYILAYPPMISQKSYTAEVLAPLIEIPTKRLETVLKGENRYVVLKRKLDPDTSSLIQEMKENEEDNKYKGLGMTEEYFRYYPESSLAANIVGYVNHDSVGQYGIESSLNSQLQGKTGKLQTKKDSIGRQITVGESTLESAVDGDDILLTIDRSIQLQVEQILASAVNEYRADSGQIIVMNPKNGSITAMAHYPSFDPNNYGDVFTKEEIYLTPEEIDDLYPTKDEGIYYFYLNAITLDKYLVFELIIFIYFFFNCAGYCLHNILPVISFILSK